MKVCGGQDCSFILDNFGYIWGCGGNSKGQNCKEYMRYSASSGLFQKIEGISDIVDICCCNQHVLCLDSNGDVWGFGDNEQGQLGITQPKKINSPTKLSVVPNVSTISTFPSTSICISNDLYYCTSSGVFKLWEFGAEVPVEEFHAASSFYFVLTTPTTISDPNTGANIKSLERKQCYLMTKLDSSLRHQLFNPKLTRDTVQRLFVRNQNIVIQTAKGKVIASGATTHCLLGHEREEDTDYLMFYDNSYPIEIPIANCVDISCGEEFLLFLDGAGICWSLGNNSYGQLGVGDFKSRNEPTRVLCSNKVTSIFASNNHSLIIDEFDNIWTFGANLYGQLGLHDKENRNKPTMISFTPPQKSAKSVSGSLH